MNDNIITNIENKLDLIEDELSAMENNLPDYLTRYDYEISLGDTWQILEMFDESRVPLRQYLASLQKSLVQLAVFTDTPGAARLEDKLTPLSKNLENVLTREKK